MKVNIKKITCFLLSMLFILCSGIFLFGCKKPVDSDKKAEVILCDVSGVSSFDTLIALGLNPNTNYDSIVYTSMVSNVKNTFTDKVIDLDGFVKEYYKVEINNGDENVYTGYLDVYDSEDGIVWNEINDYCAEYFVKGVHVSSYRTIDSDGTYSDNDYILEVTPDNNQKFLFSVLPLHSKKYYEECCKEYTFVKLNVSYVVYVEDEGIKDTQVSSMVGGKLNVRYFGVNSGSGNMPTEVNIPIRNEDIYLKGYDGRDLITHYSELGITPNYILSIDDDTSYTDALYYSDKQNVRNYWYMLGINHSANKNVDGHVNGYDVKILVTSFGVEFL